MIDKNDDYPLMNNRINRIEIYEKEKVTNEVIEIVKELSEEDLFFIMEILQLTVRT